MPEGEKKCMYTDAIIWDVLQRYFYSDNTYEKQVNKKVALTPRYLNP